MKQHILDFLQDRFDTFGLGAGTTFSEIVFATKIKRELLGPLLFELLEEKKITVRKGEHIDLYFIQTGSHYTDKR